MALSIRRAVSAVRGVLVSLRINKTPNCRSGSRNHGNDAPVCGKVLDAPDDGDDDGHEGKGTAVAEADQRSGDVGEARVVEGERGREEKIAQGEEEGRGEEKCEAGEGGAVFRGWGGARTVAF